MGIPALTVENLCLQLTADRGGAALLSGVSFEIQNGEIFGLVGESGSGKTLTALAVMRLLPPTIKATGKIMFEGRDLLALPEREIRTLRGSRMGMVFQEPVAALNPTFSIGTQLIAAIRAHHKLPKNKGEIRVSYNWKGQSPISLGASALTTYWLRAQERLDVALRYAITKNLIAKIQLNNLTSEPVEQGYLQPYAMNRYEMGRDKTYALDLTYKI